MPEHHEPTIERWVYRLERVKLADCEPGDLVQFVEMYNQGPTANVAVMQLGHKPKLTKHLDTAGNPVYQGSFKHFWSIAHYARGQWEFERALAKLDDEFDSDAEFDEAKGGETDDTR